MSEREFEYNLNMDVAIILASMREETKEIKEKYEAKDEYILIDSPINRINEINY